MELHDYVDLTRDDLNIEDIRIVPADFECAIVDSSGRQYKGFILAHSREGHALTVCDLDFQWSTTDQKYATRPTFRRTNKELEDKAVRAGQLTQRISFETGQDGYREFWRMIAFLYKFNEVVDVGDFANSYRAVSDEGVVLHLKERDPEEQKQVLARYAELSDIDVSELSDLLTLRARKADVEEFRRLLDDENGRRAAYRAQYGAEIKGPGNEALWHHFLSRHKWIFGLSLDLRFIEDFVGEAAVGIGDTTNRGNPRSDMLAWSDYTVLIELKTPDTDMFTVRKTQDARANTWSFSPAFVEGFSQCLAQRSDWEKQSENKTIAIEDGQGRRKALERGIIRTIDPQVIFIIGNKGREIPKESRDLDVWTKRDTLERFIRNNRNVNIISYDELYRRAYHIVYGTQP